MMALDYWYFASVEWNDEDLREIIGDVCPGLKNRVNDDIIFQLTEIFDEEVREVMAEAAREYMNKHIEKYIKDLLKKY